MRLPDRHHRPGGGDEAQRGMRRQAQGLQLLRGEGGQRLGRKRGGVGRVVGEVPGQFEAGDVGQIRHRGGGLAGGDEGGQVLAVSQQFRFDRRMGPYEVGGHPLEEILADQLRRHREGRAQRVEQTELSVVAVDAQALRHRNRTVVQNVARQLVRFEPAQRHGGDAALQLTQPGHCGPPPRGGCGWRFRPPPAVRTRRECRCRARSASEPRRSGRRPGGRGPTPRRAPPSRDRR